MDLSKEKVKRFANVLKDLAEKPPKTHEPLEAAILDEVYIHLIPANTVHPLENIIGNQSESFFLISKAPPSEANDSDKENSFNSCSDSEQLADKMQETAANNPLQFTKVQKVSAGSPITQELVFMSKQEAFHPVGEKENTKWYISADMLYPCSLKEARYYISLYVQGLKISNLHSPLWVMCNSALPQRAIYMGSLQPSESEGTIVRNLLVKQKGPYTSQDALPSLEQIQKEHLGSMRANPNAEVVTHGYAKYDLLGSDKYEVEFSHSALVMEFQWEGVKSLFESPPMSSNGLLHIMAVPGDTKSASRSIYTELQQLTLFSDCLASEDIGVWPVGDTDNFVVDKIQEFLADNMETTKLPQPETSPDKDILNESDGDMTSIMARRLIPEFVRNDLDFTERLWGLVRSAVDYKDLCQSLLMVFTAIVQGDVQPEVHSSSRTILGNFIRDSFQCESFAERSKLLNKVKFDQSQENLLPLQCVVEIAIEKLRRDFTNYFISQELTTLNQLEFYLQRDAALVVQVELLQKLHNILEILLQCKGFIQLKHENLRLLMQAGMAYYKTHPATDHPFFTLSFPIYKSSTLVKDISTVHQPTVWKVAMTTGNQSEKHTSVVELSCKPPHAVAGSQNTSQTINQSCSIRQNCTLVDDTTLMGTAMLDDKETFLYYISQALQSKLQIA